MAYVQKIRPRVENAKLYKEERAQWKNWHKEQESAEVDLAVRREKSREKFQELSEGRKHRR